MPRKAEKVCNKIKKSNAKLRNNYIFGKPIEYSGNADVQIVTNRKQHLKWLFRPTFKREKQFFNASIPIEKEKYGRSKY